MRVLIDGNVEQRVCVCVSSRARNYLRWRTRDAKSKRRRRRRASRHSNSVDDDAHRYTVEDEGVEVATASGVRAVFACSHHRGGSAHPNAIMMRP